MFKLRLNILDFQKNLNFIFEIVNVSPLLFVMTMELTEVINMQTNLNLKLWNHFNTWMRVWRKLENFEKSLIGQRPKLGPTAWLHQDGAVHQRLNVIRIDLKQNRKQILLNWVFNLYVYCAFLIMLLN